MNEPHFDVLVESELPEVLVDEVSGRKVKTERWMPETPEDFEFLTLQMMLCDMEIQANQAKLNAVTEHVKNVNRRINARKQAMIWRWGKLMAHHALECEKKTKKRTVATPFGSFGHRKTKGTITIVAEESALELFRDRFPNAIVTKEKISTSLLSEQQRDFLFSCTDEDLLEAGITVERPGDLAYVHTGISASKLNTYEPKQIAGRSPEEDESRNMEGDL